MKRIDNYPTRLSNEGEFIERSGPIDYSGMYDDFERDGYFIMRNVLPPIQFSGHIQLGLQTKEPNGAEVRATTGIHESVLFTPIVTNTNLVQIIRSILGGDIYIHQSRINYKRGMVGSGWHWHSDFETWHAQDGMPGMRCLTAMVPLTSNTAFNGPLLVIPGSHKYFYSCPKSKQEFSAQENFANQKEGLPDTKAIERFFYYCNNRIEQIICEPGDVVLFDCNIIHGSVANMTPFDRTNAFFVYNSINNQLEQPFSASCERPEEMGARANVKVL